MVIPFRGKNIRINNLSYKIIGVLKDKGQSAMGQDQDDMIIVPLTTAQERMLGISYVHYINIQVSESSKMDYVQKKIELLLHKRHNIKNNRKNDFSVQNLTRVCSYYCNNRVLTGIIKLWKLHKNNMNKSQNICRNKKEMSELPIANFLMRYCM